MLTSNPNSARPFVSVRLPSKRSFLALHSSFIHYTGGMHQSQREDKEAGADE